MYRAVSYPQYVPLMSGGSGHKGGLGKKELNKKEEEENGRPTKNPLNSRTSEPRDRGRTMNTSSVQTKLPLPN